MRDEVIGAGTEAPEQRFVRVRESNPPRWAAAAVTGLLAVIVVCAIVAASGVPEFEADALEWVNGWPDAPEPIFWTVQQFGVLFAPLAVGVAVAVAGRRWTLIVPFLLVLPLKLLLERTVLKFLVERERPYTSIGPWIDARGGEIEGLSFPSGHAITAFATAVLLAALLPGLWRFVPTVIATLVGLARLYMGEHNLLDVVAGAAIGAIFGFVLWYLVLSRPAISGADEHRIRGRSVAGQAASPRLD